MKDLIISAESAAVAELADAVLRDGADAAAISATEAAGLGYHPQVWTALRETGLLDLVAPEAAGGAGLGLDAIAVLAQHQGRYQVPGPIVPILLAQAALARTLPASVPLWRQLVGGEVDAVPVLDDPVRPAAIRSTCAQQRLHGAVEGVALRPDRPTAFVVIAVGAQGEQLHLVAPEATGVTIETRHQSDHSTSARLHLAEVEAQPLGGSEEVNALRNAARVAWAARQLGVVRAAIDLTADHVTDRVQFGHPLGSFQAVQHRLADAVIATEALRATCLHALRETLADPGGATRATLVAQWWTAAVHTRVLLATQHLHGGLGVDITHPIHRTYLWGRQGAVALGGALVAEAQLGACLAGTSA